jgi:hypothetical protein
MKMASGAALTCAGIIFVSVYFLEVDLKDSPQLIVMTVGVSIAVFAVFANAHFARRQARIQHSMKILLETRHSNDFNALLRARKAVWAEGVRIDPLTFESYLALDPNGPEEETRKLHAAEAVRALLNYYEFLALGIARGDLDEAMLRETVRGIMCNLVIDCLGVIDAQRARNPLTLRHLTALYLRWKRPEDPEPAETA